jgi:chromosome segregation ATPase
MTNPLLLPPRLLLRALDDLHAIAQATERLPDLEQQLFERLASLEQLDALEQAIAALPRGIEQVLSPHLERQVEGIKELHPELVASRENSGQVAPLLETLLAQIEGLRAEMATIREAVAPLRAAAERIDRLTDRLPGTS